MLVRVPKNVLEEALEAKLYLYSFYLNELVKQGVIYSEGDNYCFRWRDKIPDNVPVQVAFVKGDSVGISDTTRDLLHLIPTDGLIVLNARNINRPYPDGYSKTPNIKGYLVLSENKSLCNRLSRFSRVLANDFQRPTKAFGIEPPSKTNLLQALVGGSSESPELLKPRDSKAVCNIVELATCYTGKVVETLYSFI